MRMDIATTPSNPQGNPELADAAPNPAEPPVIRREDYKPYPWAVPETKLHFDLGIEKTTVTATLSVRRNAKADASQVLRLPIKMQMIVPKTHLGELATLQLKAIHLKGHAFLLQLNHAQL